MLHLFGFNLPETHHLYFLASSFTDFWRRINIYWKDFMMKVFYYPVVLRAAQARRDRGAVIATALVFVGDVGPALVPVVLDSRLVLCSSGTTCSSGRSSRCWSWSIRCTRPGMAGSAWCVAKHVDLAGAPLAWWLERPGTFTVICHPVVALDQRIGLRVAASGSRG